MELATDLICRICLQELELHPLFDPDADGLIIADKIMKCFSLKIDQSENVPEKICDTCLSELNAAYRFRTNCEQSNALLFNLRKVKIEMDIDSVKQEVAECEETTNAVTDSSHIVQTSSIVPLGEELHKYELYTEPGSEATPSLAIIKTEHTERDENNIKVENEIEIGSESVQDTAVTITPTAIAENNEISENSPQSLWSCAHCDKVFNYEYKLMMHSRKHPEFACSISICDNKNSKPSKRTCHKIMHRIDDQVYKDVFPCKFCEKKFCHSYTRSTHERLHSKDPIKCETCEKVFSYTHCLKRHIYHCHTKSRKDRSIHKCDRCGDRFTTRGSLRRHCRQFCSELKSVNPSQNKSKSYNENSFLLSPSSQMESDEYVELVAIVDDANEENTGDPTFSDDEDIFNNYNVKIVLR